ncbi:gp20 [Bacillus phage W.Ph.]|uniref:Gp20 n=1 Tax=Bacillus phage W.Ph. TaxID=764595 RepID=G9B1C1_9CAUD|nr:gp20 [Bacillus phage W.Ph.]ADH03166.1 gp20 [Bacillus phage W.Ph.]
MLPSIDSYIHKQIQTTLEMLLSNRYIIEELLKEVQDSVREKFIRAYVFDEALQPNPREIPIVYAMPQTKQQMQGTIYISLRGGEETHTSLNNLESTYSNPEVRLRSQVCDVKIASDERMYFEVDYPVSSMESVSNVTFTDKDNITYEGNRIYFNYSSDLEGLGGFTVWYNEASAKSSRVGEFGVRSGFTSTEHYSILVISTNMDIVRCLDLLLKAVLIYMRSNAEEQTNYLLQGISYGQMEEMNSKDGSDTPEILYGRETIVTYTTSYSLDVPIVNKIEEIVLNNKNITLNTQGGKM